MTGPVWSRVRVATGAGQQQVVLVKFDIPHNRCENDPLYTCYLTDMVCIFKETVKSDEFGRRFKNLNSDIDIDDPSVVAEDLGTVLRNIEEKSETKVNLVKSIETCDLELNWIEYGVPMKWKFNLLKGDEQDFHDQLTSSLIQGISVLISDNEKLNNSKVTVPVIEQRRGLSRSQAEIEFLGQPSPLALLNSSSSANNNSGAPSASPAAAAATRDNKEEAGKKRAAALVKPDLTAPLKQNYLSKTKKQKLSKL